MLTGKKCFVDGIAYGAGLMPPLEKTHTDEQIAHVLTYAGERWHGWNHAVTAEEVARIRKEIEARTAPWTSEELKALKK